MERLRAELLRIRSGVAEKGPQPADRLVNPNIQVDGLLFGPQRMFQKVPCDNPGRPPRAGAASPDTAGTPASPDAPPTQFAANRVQFERSELDGRPICMAGRHQHVRIAW